MAGFPGSGKSTLTRQITKNISAIIIDHDIVKSALLDSMESNIDPKIAGKISYNIEWNLIDFHLSQGHNVIFDSPCFYKESIEKGERLSKKYSAKYKYIECYLNDYHEINNRLEKRERMISQIQQITSEEVFKKNINSSKRPSDNRYLIIDSSRPLDSYINEVLKYINK